MAGQILLSMQSSGLLHQSPSVASFFSVLDQGTKARLMSLEDAS